MPKTVHRWLEVGALLALLALLGLAAYLRFANLWRNWAVPNMPAVAEMLREAETWPLVFQSGEITVYRGPVAR